jgi:hypothetical protein
MARILAIEPDPARATTLQRLVRESLDTDVVLATSAEAAIAAMTEDPPDLILTSTLLAPGDDQQLAAHLRHAPTLRHLPILTLPPLIDHDETPRTAIGGLVSRLMRRKPRTWSSCDFDAVATRIRETIEESRLAAAQYRATAVKTDIVEAPGTVLQMTDEELRMHCGLGSKRKRARRWTGPDLPWISNVKLSWGLELRLLNISSSGLLVESGIRLTPGSRTAFQLGGPNKDLVVAARVVRSRVSNVDPLGVRYVSAAQFEQSFDSLTPGDEPQGAAGDPAGHLKDLVARVREGAEAGANPVDLRTEFEAGVHDLVTAREVRLRETPVVENDGRDSIYFTIPSHDGAPAILQVTFEPNYRPGPEEFAALRAASVAAADVVPFTELSRQVSVAPA